MPVDLLHLHFIVRERGLRRRVPVHQPLAAVDQAVLEELEERLAHGARARLVHRERLAVPVARAAHRLELVGDALLRTRPSTPGSSRRTRRAGSRCGVLPSSASTRFSTTVCVAMPAWSVPGSQTALSPAMRCQRIRMSWSVLFSAWPRCSAAVTLGGGMTIAVRLAGIGRLGVEARLSFHSRSMSRSIDLGSYDFGNSVVGCS